MKNIISIFIVLLNISIPSVLSAQVEEKEISYIKPIEYIPSVDYKSIIEKTTGLKYYGKIYSDASDKYFIVLHGNEKDIKYNTNQYSIVQVDSSEAVNFVSNYRFSKVEDSFHRNLLNVTRYDSIAREEIFDVLHISGNIVGDFKYRFLENTHSIFEEGDRATKKPRWAFDKGLARVELLSTDRYNTPDQNRKRGLIDTLGQLLTDSLFYNVHSFIGDSAMVTRYDPESPQPRTRGFINRKVELVVPFKFLEIQPFDENFMLATTKDKYHPHCLIDKQYNIIIYDVNDIEKCSNSVWLINASGFGDNSCYFNPITRKAISKRYVALKCPCADGLPSTARLTWGEPFVHVMTDWSGVTYGLVNASGHEILPVIYNGLSGFNKQRLLLVEKDDKKVAWGNEKGEIISEWFDRLNKFDKYSLCWAKRDGKWAVVNTQGKIISNWFVNAWDYSEGLAAVKIDAEIGYIDTLGNMVIEPQFTQAGDFIEGYALVEIKEKEKGDKVGVINQKGEWIIEPNYTEDDLEQLDLKMKELNIVGTDHRIKKKK